MKFKVEIDCDGDAFFGDSITTTTANVLRHIAERVENHPPSINRSIFQAWRSARDINGNTCAAFGFTDKE